MDFTRPVLAIDTAARTGWAIYHNKKITSGAISLDSKRIEGPGMRLVRLTSFLDKIEMDYGKPQLVVTEEVRHHLGVSAAHWYGSYCGVIQMWCEERKIDYTGAAVQSVKAFALGNHRAKDRKNSKKEMVTRAQELFGKHIKDDNEADACLILAWAVNDVFHINLLDEKNKENT
ncbi:hypothetical protein HY496_01070 [Candidatus Woesearchaeota archaeon]|nr:hypothetical protein [Candidatus Woesearchaeota archaeon]